MVLQRWYPMYELRRMHDAMNRRWREFGVATEDADRMRWAIPIDVVEEGDDYLVRASLPGVSPDDIDVSIEDHVLAIKAETQAEQERKEGGYLVKERRAGSFRRSLRLPKTVDTDKAETLFENGVLTITLPKAEATKAKRLKVGVEKAPEAKTK